MMVVNVDQIKDKGMVLKERLEPAFLQETLAEGPGKIFEPTGASDFHAELRKMGSGVLVTGSLSAPLHTPCARCLNDVTLTVPIQFVLSFVKKTVFADEGDDEDEDEKGGQSSESIGSFGLKDADEETFDGKTIDLGPVVREQLMLALPMSVLCREDCRGLCPVCGQDLNLQPCKCDRHVPDPRLAALKNIKLS